MKRFSRRHFVRTVGVGAAALVVPRFASSEAAPRRKPNVIFILADDLGWRDTSLYGSTFCETPNVERLARRGMMFSQAYAANPLCSPTRASIQTGLWPARMGITAPVCHVKEEKFEETVREKAPPSQKVLVCDSATRLKQEYYTLAEALKDAGYKTGHFGKWHLGHEPYDPFHQGFDVDVPHWPGPGPAGSYVAPWKFPASLNFTGQSGEHIEDRMASEAVKFIKENKDRPFFLNYWCFSVHAPWDAKKALIEKYRAKADPKSLQRNPVYGAMVESMDDAVGRLLTTLDELGLADNTIIVFFSDNGGVQWAGSATYPDTPITSNSPLRGGKATVYEGGTREPCVVVWPGQVKPASKSDAIIQSIDFYPTILEITGLKPKDGLKFDGISIVPALKQTGAFDREAIFCFFPHATGVPDAASPAVYVRQGDWKLIRFFHDGPNFAHRHELYNLKDDLGETNNLASTMPDRVKELDALIERFLNDTHAVLPKPNPAYAPSQTEWEPSKDAMLSVKDGLLIVEATGKDPFISIRRLPKWSGETTIEFRMRSTASGPAQVFWGVAGARPLFAAQRSAALKVAHDGQWRDYSQNLPVQGVFTALRIDPANGPGRIEFDWIRLKNATGRIVKEWNFEETDAARASSVNAAWASPESVMSEG
jgi:arylsulfatase A-like enzyme